MCDGHMLAHLNRVITETRLAESVTVTRPKNGELCARCQTTAATVIAQTAYIGPAALLDTMATLVDLEPPY